MEKNQLLKSKKAVTLTSVLEIMLFSILFVGALAVIGTNMNNAFSDNKDLTYGLVDNASMNSLNNLQASMESSRKTGLSGISSLGIFTLTTLPQMISTILTLTLNFVTGGWINNLVGLMNLGEISGLVITILKLLYYFLILFVLIRILTRTPSV